MARNRESPDLAVGDRVQLRYTGDRAVPLYLANTWATVVGRTPRGRVIVRPDLDARERRITSEHIRWPRRAATPPSPDIP